MQESSGTSAPSRPRPSWWTDWPGWSTGATTRRVSPYWASSELKGAQDAGRVRELEASLPKRFGGKLGIGHTRWATHGGPSKDNAHPHASGNERIAVVHNGIFDNAGALRAQLEDAGVKLRSETDTEVLAHLIEQSDGATLEEKVHGRPAPDRGHLRHRRHRPRLPDRIVVARNGSPLILGIGDGEMHVASDTAALIRYTRQVVYLDDGEMADRPRRRLPHVHAGRQRPPPRPRRRSSGKPTSTSAACTSTS